MFILSVISGFRREVNEDRSLLGYYAASSSNLLPTFRDNLSRFCPEMSVIKYYLSRNNPEERRSHGFFFPSPLLRL
jgi:hypothetical protein